MVIVICWIVQTENIYSDRIDRWFDRANQKQSDRADRGKCIVQIKEGITLSINVEIELNELR